MTTHSNRRQWLSNISCTAALGAAGAVLAQTTTAAAETADQTTQEKLRYCLNTSTLRGHKLTLVEEIEIAAEAGYDGIEPWMGEINQHQKAGGSLNDLRKRIADAGLKVESAIGFARWIVDDPEARRQGLEAARRDMDMLRQIGGTRIAAPPTGATKQTGFDLFAAASRYADLCAVGEQMGVTPQLEVWGFSKTLSRLGETALVAIESGRADACILPDVYHIYKGGSDFNGFRLLNAAKIHVLHMNDYPADPPRETISDADRVYPGDGVAPLNDILQTLTANGFRGALSLELFNRTYWKRDARQVARTGLEKMRAAVHNALG